MAEQKKTKKRNFYEWLEDEPYYPELEEEDYSAAAEVSQTNLRHVNITEEMFKSRVDEAFRKRMAKILYPKQIEESIDSPVYRRCVSNKFKEVTRDNNNEFLSQEKVIRGHVASLMHCLYLIFS